MPLPRESIHTYFEFKKQKVSGEPLYKHQHINSSDKYIRDKQIGMEGNQKRRQWNMEAEIQNLWKKQCILLSKGNIKTLESFSFNVCLVWAQDTFSKQDKDKKKASYNVMQKCNDLNLEMYLGTGIVWVKGD